MVCTGSALDGAGRGLRGGRLLALATDVAFTNRKGIVFQEVNVRDDGQFFDGQSKQPLEPVVVRALEEFKNRFNSHEIRDAVTELLHRPNKAFLNAIADAIEAARRAGVSASPAMPVGRVTPSSSSPSASVTPVVSGTVVSSAPR